MHAADRRVTYAEMLEWPDDGRQYELYDGEAIVVPSPFPRHQRVAFNIAQLVGRHAEAADAYRVGLAVQSSNPQAWMGLGISLEALQQRAAASDAFKNALAAGPVSAELRTFAEQRIRALR